MSDHRVTCLTVGQASATIGLLYPTVHLRHKTVFMTVEYFNPTVEDASPNVYVGSPIVGLACLTVGGITPGISTECIMSIHTNNLLNNCLLDT